jgi:hypothetical protein
MIKGWERRDRKDIHCAKKLAKRRDLIGFVRKARNEIDKKLQKHW